MRALPAADALIPQRLSAIIDQAPPLRDPKSVLSEIAAAPAPRAYLQSLHPKHEQFQRLREALLKARGIGGDDAAKKPRNEQEIQRILINMERWRWMPPNLGTVYVQDNVPEFMLYVVKNGKTIHSDKIAVGELRYATPIFSADMQTIVFNPEWTAPPSVVREDLLPNLRSGGWFGGSSILRQHGLQVKYNGRTVDPGSINWNSVNMANIAFTQPRGRGMSWAKLNSSTRTNMSSICTTPSGLICSSRRCAPSAITAFAWRSRAGLRKFCSRKTRAGTHRRSRISSTRAMTAR